jgi:hypothetical protein
MLASLLCHADPRWCAVSEKDPSNVLVYPPIARAARVQGVVVMRMIYSPNGKVVRTEPVFGPIMLSNSSASQVLGWTLRTAAAGEEQCVTELIVRFHFHDPDGSFQLFPPQPNTPGILRLSVEEEVLVISDPGADLATNPFRAFGYEIRRLARHLFRRGR